MPTPSNHKELQLQLLLGKINYYDKLFNDRAAILAPLYDCNNSETFEWNNNCQNAFNQAKKELKRIIVNYDPTLPLILTCNASPRDLGAVISQPYAEGEKPVAFASARLTNAQKNYSQIDKEAAIIFGVTKFYDYIFARKFILRTDNKPLSRILSPEEGIPRMASRLQNWSYFLSAFDYRIECIGTKENIVADTLYYQDTLDYREKAMIIINEILNVTGHYAHLHYVVESKIACLDYKAVTRVTAKDSLIASKKNGRKRLAGG